MLTKGSKTQSVFLFLDTLTPMLRYGSAVLAVAIATVATQYIPVIGERAAFLFFFFAISQTALWLGSYPGFLALVLSFISANSLILLQAWSLKPYEALVINAGFCGISAIFIAIAHLLRKLNSPLLEKPQDLGHAKAIGNIGNWWLDVRHNELRWSDENYQIFGIPKDTALTYESFLATVHPEDRDYVDRQWQAALRGEPYDIEHRIVVDGKITWLREKATLEFDNKGNLLGAFGTTQDITDLKLLQHGLLESQQRYAGIAESAMDAAITKRKMGGADTISGLRANGEEFPSEASISQPEEHGRKSYGAILRDISERVHTGILLKERHILQDQISKIAASVPGLICSFRMRPDGSSHMPFASPAIESVFGLRADIVAEDFSPVFARIHPDDIDRVNETTIESARTLQPWLGEFRYFHPIKGEIWIESHSMPQSETDGSILWHGYVQDITERKLAEMAIRDRENELQLIMDATPALISYLDTDFRYLRINKAYEDWCCIPREHIVGQDVRKIIGEKAWGIVHPYLEQARSGERVNFDYQVSYGDDNLCWVHSNYIPDKDSTGVVKGIVIHIVDIDDRKQAAQKISILNRNLQHRIEEMQVIFDTVPIGLAKAYDTESHHIHGNPAYEKLLGLPPGSEFYNKGEPNSPYRIFGHGQLLPLEKLPMQRAIQGEIVNNQIIEVRRLDGKTVTLLANASPLFHDDGLPRGAIGAFLDISELKQAERMVRESEERMRLATEATGVGIWEWNVITNKIRWDAQMFRIYGIAPTQDGVVEYHTWSSSVIPEDLPQQEAILQDTARRDARNAREFRILRAGDNKIRHIQAVETTRKNSQGRVEWVVGTNLDITEQKNAARALQASEERLALGVQTAGLALAEVDYGTGLIHLSAKAAQLFGLGETDMVVPRAAVHSTFHPDDRRELLRRIDECLDPSSNGRFDMHHRVLLPKGKVRWLNIHEQVTFSGEGKQRRPICATLAISDITKEKEAEGAVLASEAFVRSVLNSLPEYVVVLDINGVVTAVNEPWERFANENDAAPHAVSVGANYLDVCRRPSSSGDPYARQALAGLEDLLAGRRQEFIMEYPCPTPSLERWFLMHAKRLEQGIEGIILSHVDITERKQTEIELRSTQARLALVVEEVNAGYWDWDLKANTLYLSPEWNRQLGLDNDEALFKWDRQNDRLHPDDRAMVMAVTENYLAGHQPNFEIQFRLRHKDGSYRWIHSHGALLRDQHNKPYRMLGLNLDITDYIKGKELKERRDEMEKSFRLYIATQTAAAIAHELNQPLTAISYYAYVAQNILKTGNQDPQKLTNVMEKCGQQAQRAGNVIQQLLTLLHKGETVSEPVDINASAKDAVDFIKAHSQLDAFKIELNLTDDLPPVTANSLQVQKVLVNLLNNGLESMAESGRSGGTITVTTGRPGNDPALAQVSVKDCGTGALDMDDLDKIFQPFYTTKPRGLGMGLAISRTLIEAHGGKMWAEENTDSGISVHFTLPFML